MSMNALGKTLVLIHLVLAMLLLAWASVLFLQPVDWGWKEARRAYAGETKKANERVAARIDLRVAAYGKLAEAKFAALGRAKQAQATRAEAEQFFGYNHRLYQQVLTAL